MKHKIDIFCTHNIYAHSHVSFDMYCMKELIFDFDVKIYHDQRRKILNNILLIDCFEQNQKLSIVKLMNNANTSEYL